MRLTVVVVVVVAAVVVAAVAAVVGVVVAVAGVVVVVNVVSVGVAAVKLIFSQDQGYHIHLWKTQASVRLIIFCRSVLFNQVSFSLQLFIALPTSNRTLNLLKN